ncbi:MAG: hypothetical protein U9R43_04535 [Thermodesulfobacteriota bacterium]|nr:hypothetical protein [Thermodesulfobacteriota bacterium]
MKSVKWLYKALVVILFAYVLLTTFTLSMQNAADHDDNPYIAAAKVTAEEGLIPYKDYRFIHMPYYVFVYALIFKFTSSVTLIMRIISFLAFSTILILIFHSIQKTMTGRNQIFKFLIGASTIFFIIYSPIVNYAFARFTYDIPLLLSILAFLLLTSIVAGKKSFLKAFLSGLFIGIAIGFRLHFILFAIPFALGVLLFLNLSLSLRLKLVICFSAGIFAGLIPVIVLVLIAPREFIFDVFEFHFSIDKQFLNHQKRLFTFGKRLRDFFAIISQSWHTLVLFFGVIWLAGLRIFKVIKDEVLNFRLAIILLTLPFLIYLAIGKILIYQYLYPLVIVSILGFFYGLSALKKYANIGTLVVSLLAFFMLWQGDPLQLSELKKPEDWTALSRYRCSRLVDEALTGPTRILTLSPAEILESDSIQIYKEFVSSPFLWRTSYLIPDHLREQLNIISEKEIQSFLQENQPDAIFTGYEWEVLEKSFIEFARENGYTEIDIPNVRDLKLYIRSK